MSLVSWLHRRSAARASSVRRWHPATPCPSLWEPGSKLICAHATDEAAGPPRCLLRSGTDLGAGGAVVAGGIISDDVILVCFAPHKPGVCVGGVRGGRNFHAIAIDVVAHDPYVVDRG